MDRVFPHLNDEAQRGQVCRQVQPTICRYFIVVPMLIRLMRWRISGRLFNIRSYSQPSQSIFMKVTCPVGQQIQHMFQLDRPLFPCCSTCRPRIG